MESIITIPLTRARYPNAFARVLDGWGVSSESLYEKAKLPVGALARPDLYLPIQKFHLLLDLAVRAAGTQNLGFHAAQVEFSRYGEFGRHLLGCASLYQALNEFCRLAKMEYSKADFFLKSGPNKIWFCRGPIDGTDSQKRQTELYILVMMIQTVQLFVGSTWRPQTICLQTQSEEEFDQLVLLDGSDLRFGSHMLAIDLPQHFLSKSVTRYISGALRDTSDLPGQTVDLADDYASSLRRLLVSYIDSGLSIGVAAELAGVSVRTLQRRLAETGHNYSTVVERVRFEVALPLVKNPDIRLTDIAFELGYKDASHLARAFRRWAGVTPNQLRRKHVS